jgi:hypothetical protein
MHSGLTIRAEVLEARPGKPQHCDEKACKSTETRWENIPLTSVLMDGKWHLIKTRSVQQGHEVLRRCTPRFPEMLPSEEAEVEAEVDSEEEDGDNEHL